MQWRKMNKLKLKLNYLHRAASGEYIENQIVYSLPHRYNSIISMAYPIDLVGWIFSQYFGIVSQNVDNQLPLLMFWSR